MQVMIFCIFFLDFSLPTEIVEKIRQLYRTREQRLLPVPWCEDFSFHLNEIFTSVDEYELYFIPRIVRLDS